MKPTRLAVTGLFALLFCASTQVMAQTENQETQRAKFMQSYNELAGMNDTQWTKAMVDGAISMEKSGQPENAKVLYKLANPTMRAFALDLFKSKIDDNSQNGLIHIGYRWWCAGMGCFWLFLMTVFTLDGNEVDNF